MKRVRLMILFIAFVGTSCQKEEEESKLKKLSQEAEEGTFPNTVKESQQLQKEVKKLNVEVKEESQERIKMINKELEKKQIVIVFFLKHLLMQSSSLSTASK